MLITYSLKSVTSGANSNKPLTKQMLGKILDYSSFMLGNKVTTFKDTE